MENDALKKKVQEVLDKIRIGLKQEGGDIELIDIKGGIVYVRLTGTCAVCQMSSLTMKNWVEKNLKREIPEIEAVKEV